MNSMPTYPHIHTTIPFDYWVSWIRQRANDFGVSARHRRPQSGIVDGTSALRATMSETMQDDTDNTSSDGKKTFIRCALM